MSEPMDWTGPQGAAWAREWRRTDRSFGGLTDKLLQRSREFAFGTALDVGCGAGELSLAIARGRPSVKVRGVDISPALVSAARERGERLSNVMFEIGDASDWQPADGYTPDLLVSRHGVMFFADPVAAFSHLASLAAPGAGLLFSCFRGPAENAIFTGVAGLLPPPVSPPDPHAPGPMAFADPGRVRDILGAAGWAAIEVEPFDFAMVAGAGEDPVADAIEYFHVIGPAASRISAMGEAERAEFEERLAGFVEAHLSGGIVALGAAAWIVSARKG